MDSIIQSLLPTPDYPRTIGIRYFSRRQAENASEIAEAGKEPYLGLSVTLSTSGEVSFVAVATPKEVFLISVDVINDLPLVGGESLKATLSGVLGSTLVGFEMARLAIQINRDLGTMVCGIDLGTICSGGTRSPWRPGELVTNKVCSSAKSFDIDSIWSGSSENEQRDVCLRAWISACAASGVTTELHKALKVNTDLLTTKELCCLGELVKQADLLEAAKPKEVPNEFTSHATQKDGTLSIINARYRTRVRKDHQTTVVMTDANGRDFAGKARGSRGKKTFIQFTGPKLSGAVARIRVVGREELTNAEKACNEILLLFLRKQEIIQNSVFVRMLWFPPRKQLGHIKTKKLTSPITSIPLNDSQLQAVQAMISDSLLVVVHGPPGTGKTTTISAAASIWAKARQNTWIVAHSNVAVKNIAEKLFKNGVDFKILVSKEFYVEWHEHIYTLVGDSLIRIDKLPPRVADTQKVIGNSCIILSTLMDRLVIDEASQIKIFDFMSVFARFSNLKKVCFFGDPKQLPPYGKDTAPNLQTIFDLAHLKNSGTFLDTQYRMPVPIGAFISKNVYGGKLRSKHTINDTSCVSFINVAEGIEKKGGFSWRNFAEIRTIVHLVRSYYKHKEFCVITPYDAQRAAIAKALKDENLPWECVFNVDSFQGNEAKYVLISVVRTGRPGFLTSLNRMNVMLTRCKAGLVVVTNRLFLRAGGADTLLGKMAQYWEGRRGADVWVDWRLVASEEVDLPGAPGRNRTSNSLRPVYLPVAPQPKPPAQKSPPLQTNPVAPISSYNGYGQPSHSGLPKAASGPSTMPPLKTAPKAPPMRPVRPWTVPNYETDFPGLQGPHPSKATSTPSIATTRPLNRPSLR